MWIVILVSANLQLPLTDPSLYHVVPINMSDKTHQSQSICEEELSQVASRRARKLGRQFLMSYHGVNKYLMAESVQVDDDSRWIEVLKCVEVK